MHPRCHGTRAARAIAAHTNRRFRNGGWFLMGRCGLREAPVAVRRAGWDRVRTGNPAAALRTTVVRRLRLPAPWERRAHQRSAPVSLRSYGAREPAGGPKSRSDGLARRIDLGRRTPASSGNAMTMRREAHLPFFHSADCADADRPYCGKCPAFPKPWIRRS